MQRRQAFKFELHPNGRQQRQMRRFAGACRFVFNKALDLQKERYAQGEQKLGYAGLCKLLTEWRNGSETPWLANVPIHPLQQTLKDLERVYANFFAKRAAFPKFKRKGQGDSYPCAATAHQPGLFRVWPCRERQPAQSGQLHMHGLQRHQSRRRGGGHQCFRARIALVSLWRGRQTHQACKGTAHSAQLR